MREVLFLLGERPVTVVEAALAAGGFVALTLVVLLILVARAGGARLREAAGAAEGQRELDEKMVELNRIQAEMTGRMQTMAEIFGQRQSDVVRHLGERLDGLQHRVGQGLIATHEKTSESLSRLGERLAVIDAAQKNLTDLTREVVSLKDVLANKQARGAYGQARMEAIIRDGLPPNAYAFQATLAGGRRPDCLVNLPGDPRPLAIDAKFPLEAFAALKDAQGPEALRQAETRARADLSVHVKDVAEKYLVPGETQDFALIFVPSEAVYAEIVDRFDEVVQKAHRARVVIVSPTLLMMAIQVMQALFRDHRMQEEARVIQAEVRKLLADVARLNDRVVKLDNHFRQAQEDVAQIRTSADKIGRRGEKIGALDFGDEGERGVVMRAAE